MIGVEQPASAVHAPLTRVDAHAPVYRLAVLNSHPIQYFAPLYRRLAAHPQFELKVFYCSRWGADNSVDPGFGRPVHWDVPLLEGYDHVFLPNWSPRKRTRGFWSLINPAIVRELRRGCFDALWVHSYNYPTNLLAIAGARLSRTPVLYRTESSLAYDTLVRRPWWLRAAKRAVLRLLFSQVSAFLAIGTANREFYDAWGVPEERIFLVPYTVDNESFAEHARAHHAERRALRAALGISPDAVVILFAAKLIEQKHPFLLLEAYERLRDCPNCALLMVGQGTLRPQLEKFVQHRNLPQVHFLGFCNQSEMSKYYAVSDVFVRPDGIYIGDWGLTVNEAMACGLAIVASDRIAASRDLVRDDENGFLVQFGDVAGLARALRRLVTDPERCGAMGRRSQEIISHWSYDQCIEGLLAALEYLRQSPGARR